MPQPSGGLDLSWKLVDLLSKKIAAEAARDGVPDVVIGVLRGGMIPAVIVAHELNVIDMRGLEVTHSHIGQLGSAKTGLPMVRNCESLGNLIGADVLLVDDLATSGDTGAITADLTSAASRVRQAVLALDTISWPGDPIRKRPEYVGTLWPGPIGFPWEKR